MNARILLLAIAGISTWLAYADTVYLTNGNALEGRVRYENGKIIVEQPSGEVTLNPASVEYVERKKTAMDEFDERFNALAANEASTAGDFAALGHFAKDKNLPAAKTKAYRQALELDPAHAESRQALGYVKFGGAWMTPDEANLARGLVKHGGQWVTPEAKSDLMKLQAEGELARARAESEHLRAERLEKALELIEAERARDTYYPTAGRYSGPVIIPSQLWRRRYILPPSSFRPLRAGDSMFPEAAGIGRSIFQR